MPKSLIKIGKNAIIIKTQFSNNLYDLKCHLKPSELITTLTFVLASCQCRFLNECGSEKSAIN